jgi:CRP/FNR family transcriptional regulator, anaerobic regulatory protein
MSDFGGLVAGPEGTGMPFKDVDGSIERFLEIYGRLFPATKAATIERQRALDSLHLRHMEAGTTILREGQVCTSVPFVIDGVIRVFKASESGREITLYRIEAGQSCILSASCGSSLSSFPATVVAEKATSAAFMPIGVVRALFAEVAAFRDYILEQYSLRMAEVMELVEEVAFRRVDERLAQWLKEQCSASPSGLLVATHQTLADHVGTSREVVSRILKDWEQRGALEISRGSLRLLPGFERMRENLTK